MTDRLRALAVAATPGPWHIDDTDPSDVVVRSAIDQRWVSNIGNWSRQLPMPMALDSDRLQQVYEADAADAAYIAALSPDVAIALCDRVGALEAALLEGIEAFRLTREYVGEDALPAIEGWSWCDWVTTARAALGGRP